MKTIYITIEFEADDEVDENEVLDFIENKIATLDYAELKERTEILLPMPYIYIS